MLLVIFSLSVNKNAGYRKVTDRQSAYYSRLGRCGVIGKNLFKTQMLNTNAKMCRPSFR